MGNTIILSELNTESKIVAAETTLPYGYRSLFEVIRLSDKSDHLKNIYRESDNYVYEVKGDRKLFSFATDLVQYICSL